MTVRATFREDIELILIIILSPRCKRLSVTCTQNWSILSNPAPPHRRPIKLFRITWCVRLFLVWPFLFQRHFSSSLVMLCRSPSCAFHLQDVCQQLEKLKGTLLSLSAGARRLSDKEQAERTVTELNSSYDQNTQEAKDKQSSLENLLSLWQK